jgi:hypothetical protein
MRKLAVLCTVFALSLLPHSASAQTASGAPVSLVLMSWVQLGSTTAVVTPAQSTVGEFNDIKSCITAAKAALVADGASPLAYNFLCVPNR